MPANPTSEIRNLSLVLPEGQDASSRERVELRALWEGGGAPFLMEWQTAGGLTETSFEQEIGVILGLTVETGLDGKTSDLRNFNIGTAAVLTDGSGSGPFQLWLRITDRDGRTAEASAELLITPERPAASFAEVQLQRHGLTSLNVELRNHSSRPLRVKESGDSAALLPEPLDLPRRGSGPSGGIRISRDLTLSRQVALDTQTELELEFSYADDRPGVSQRSFRLPAPDVPWQENGLYALPLESYAPRGTAVTVALVSGQPLAQQFESFTIELDCGGTAEYVDGSFSLGGPGGLDGAWDTVGGFLIPPTTSSSVEAVEDNPQILRIMYSQLGPGSRPVARRSGVVATLQLRYPAAGEYTLRINPGPQNEYHNQSDDRWQSWSSFNHVGLGAPFTVVIQ